MMGRTRVRDEYGKSRFPICLKGLSVTRSKDVICKSNPNLRQAAGNSRCYLQNRMLTIGNTGRQVPWETVMNSTSVLTPEG